MAIILMNKALQYNRKKRYMKQFIINMRS